MRVFVFCIKVTVFIYTDSSYKCVLLLCDDGGCDEKERAVGGAATNEWELRDYKNNVSLEHRMTNRIQRA